jgi:g-D-glutamyl-meso-diaminopimelate peptidase
VDIYEQISLTAIQKIEIGKSVLGRSIYAMKAGEGRPTGLVQYAMHAREFITARLAIEQYQMGLFKGSCWFVPLVNPDGALLCQQGLSSVADREKRGKLLALNDGNEDFRLWKANANGVDLNVNFPARWGKGVKNTRKAGAENYIGEKPFSEPESLALKHFTLKVRPDYTVSYHTKGEEIYWYFYQSTRTCPRDKRLAKLLSRSTGYPLAEAKGSAGGYKDWCIQRLKIPAFTIEAGLDEYAHPLGETALEDIIEKNRFAVYDLSKGINE